MNRPVQANRASRPDAGPGQPPTAHILKPHHLQLMCLLSIVFPDKIKGDILAQTPSLRLLAIRTLMLEISEVKQPATYKQLVGILEEGAVGAQIESYNQIQDFKYKHIHVTSPDWLRVFFNGMHAMVPGREDDDGHFTRRSLFGYFARRCFISYLKLSFEGREKLYRDYHAWVAGTYDENAQYGRFNELDNSHNIFKTQADKKQFAEPAKYALWEKFQATGDSAAAQDQLRSFFEQHFHESSDSGLRQHTLLNLARMHYLRGEITAAHKLLQEAIMVARTNNDKVTLQHCLGLLHRLHPHRDTATINEIQPDLHPLEVLNDVKKLINASSQQPIAASFEKIYQANALFDNWVDVQRGNPSSEEQWAQRVIQGIVWQIHGSTQLAAVEEAAVLAFTPSGGNDSTRMALLCNRANRIARQGNYKEAVAILLHPDVWSGLTLTDYNHWASEVWHILALQASRRGQSRLFHDFLKKKRPTSTFSMKNYWFVFHVATVASSVRDNLYEVLNMREVNQAHSVVEPLLVGLWHAEFQQRFGPYRLGVLLLADVGLEFGMTKWSRRIVEEIMPQVINGDDLELRAFACVTLARCIFACVPEDKEMGDTLRESIPYLEIAEKDYTTLEICKSLQHVQYLLSIVYHNLDMPQKRDEAAARCLATETLGKEVGSMVMEQWVNDVWEIVSNVGARLAAR